MRKLIFKSETVIVTRHGAPVIDLAYRLGNTEPNHIFFRIFFGKTNFMRSYQNAGQKTKSVITRYTRGA